jgi:hypothetical protein
MNPPTGVRTLALILALVATGWGASAASAAGPLHSYESRPDLRSVALQVRTGRPGVAPGRIFLAPKRGKGQQGPLIVGDDGQPLWFMPLRDGQRATDFRVQRYAGHPVLTWWQGRTSGGRGEGEGIIADETYKVIARVRAGNGLRADLHEFTLTDRGTAVLIAYQDRRRDLRAFGGSRDGRVTDGVVQEIDVATGRVLFQWRALGAIALTDSYERVPGAGEPWDAFHLNSVDEDAAGDLLVSARHTHTVYKLRRATGDVAWRLGGKRPTFHMGPGTSFALQHDARFAPDGRIRIFDNSTHRLRKRSRVIWLRVDPAARTVTLVRERHHPDDVLSGTQSNAQELPNGDLFVGWGSQGRISELSPRGGLLLDLKLPRGWDTYRAYRAAWVGRPPTPPRAAVETRQDGGTTVYVSWNGATEVAGWQLYTGDDASSLRYAGTAPRRGFETAIRLRGPAPAVQVRAVDAHGAVLGETSVVQS